MNACRKHCNCAHFLQMLSSSCKVDKQNQWFEEWILIASKRVSKLRRWLDETKRNEVEILMDQTNWKESSWARKSINSKDRTNFVLVKIYLFKLFNHVNFNPKSFHFWSEAEVKICQTPLTYGPKMDTKKMPWSMCQIPLISAKYFTASITLHKN